MYAGSWRDVTWPDKWTAVTVVSVYSNSSGLSCIHLATPIVSTIAGREAISPVWANATSDRDRLWDTHHQNWNGRKTTLHDIVDYNVYFSCKWSIGHVVSQPHVPQPPKLVLISLEPFDQSLTFLILWSLSYRVRLFGSPIKLIRMYRFLTFLQLLCACIS